MRRPIYVLTKIIEFCRHSGCRSNNVCKDFRPSQSSQQKKKFRLRNTRLYSETSQLPKVTVYGFPVYIYICRCRGSGYFGNQSCKDDNK